MEDTRNEDYSDLQNFLIPSDDDLELDLIQSLILKPENMEQVYYQIKVSDFWNESAGKVYSILRKLYEKGERDWNVTTVAAEIGDTMGVHGVLYRVPADALFRVTPKMIQILKSKAIGRQILDQLYSLLKENAETNDRAIIVSKGMNFLSQISQRLSFTEDTKESILEKHRDLMIQRLSGKLVGIPTGFPDLDSMLGQGLQKKDLVIIGARPSVGKTSFSLSLAHNIARKKQFKILYFSLEMDAEEVLDRLVAFELNQPVTSVVRGQIKRDKLKEAYIKLKEMPLTIRYLPKATSADIFSIASKEKAINGLDLIIVDYLGLLSDESENRDNEVLRIGKLTKGLRAVAQMLDVAMVVPHQLNRKIELRAKKDQDPLLSDLRDSGHIEADADVIMFLSRDIIGKKESAVLRIGKHRTGQTGKLDLRFNPLTTKFEST